MDLHLHVKVYGYDPYPIKIKN